MVDKNLLAAVATASLVGGAVIYYVFFRNRTIASSPGSPHIPQSVPLSEEDIRRAMEAFKAHQQAAEQQQSEEQQGSSCASLGAAAAASNQTEGSSALVAAGGASAGEEDRGLQLINAACNDDVAKLQELAKTIPLTTKDKRTRTAAMLACETGKIAALKFILENCDESNVLNDVDKNGWDALMYASYDGQLEAIKTIFNVLDSNTADTKRTKTNKALLATVLKHKNNDGRTALMLACEEGHVECVKYLVLRFAPSSSSNHIGNIINEKDSDGVTATQLATSGGHLDVVRVLHEHGASMSEVTSGFGESLAMLAVKSRHLDVLRFVLDNGADVKLRDRNGRSLAMLAAFSGQVPVLELVLEKTSASYLAEEKEESTGTSCAMLAARAGQFDAFKYVVEHCGGSSNTDTNNNRSDENDNQKSASAAVIAEKDSQGRSCALFAAVSGNIAMLKYILANGGSLTRKECEGMQLSENILTLLD